MEKTEKFWQWFQDHNEQLISLGDLDEKGRQELENALQYQLTKYCDGLTYEMGDPTADGRTLTFTAEGDTDLFRYVVELVDAAPDLDWWQFVAFKQPMGTDLKVRFDKMLFETKKMYFQQLECEEEPEMLGLRIAVPFESSPKVGEVPEGRRGMDDEDFQVGVYVTLEALIGEFDCATLIGYMETVPVPAEPFKAGFQPLDDLSKFVEWFKAKRDE
ncbi:MAG: hypothetical protein J6X79_01685 [Bacteroidales bacterium]|nr:hypothetical protein [Bacteroidales bacterium]